MGFEAFASGASLQASLIAALGAQNLFVLERGIQKNRHQLVAFLSTLGDFALIAVGVGGAGVLFVRFFWLKVLFGSLGTLFLGIYGIQKIIRPLPAAVADAPLPESPTRETVLKTLGFSFLNPHVYLDTVVLIGGFSARYLAAADRASFGLGAAGISALWFFALANVASVAARWVKNSKRMKALSVVAGGVILCLAVALGRDVATWIGENGP